MTLPNVKDFARLSPPYASVVPHRQPVVKWHATQGAARTSALYDNTGCIADDDPYSHKQEVKFDCGVAKLLPNGDLIYVESYRPGDDPTRNRS